MLNEPTLIDVKVFKDPRGFFCELWRDQDIAARTGVAEWLQANWSRSDKNVLRGMHFQLPPFAQAKLVWVVSGEIKDVCVDLRKENFGKKYEFKLSGDHPQVLYIPKGFAHGLCVLYDKTDFMYRCSSLYNPQAELGIPFNDRELAIEWTTQNPIVSDRDTKWQSLADQKQNLLKLSWD